MSGPYRASTGGRAGPSTLGRSPREPSGTEPAGREPPGGKYAELRQLIVGPEQEELAGIRVRLDDPSRRAADLSESLPEALARRSADPALEAALTPTVERAIDTSVRKNPDVLVEAIFPVIGPAIRRSIASTLASMVASLNETLERSFSIEGLRWRVEALRTGKSFGEVVLLHTLEYRVEQVLLIDEGSGLLLQHVVDSGAPSRDVEVISGMLSAIRDFVADSFRIEPSPVMESMKVGDLTILVEPGPGVILAAVVRGTVPGHLPGKLQETIEKIHRHHRLLLETFDGDASVFSVVRPRLEACLEERRTTPSPRSRRGWAFALVGLVAAALLVVGGRALVDRWQWSQVVARFEAEPGFAVLDSGSRWAGHYVTGLRDPLARDPAEILTAGGFDPGDISGLWVTHDFPVGPFVLARLDAVVDPPDGVAFGYDDGTVRATGFADPGWIAAARERIPLVGGVVAYDDSALANSWEALATRAAPLEDIAVRFATGSAALDAEARTRARVAAARVDDLMGEAARLGVGVHVDVVGHADSSGQERRNDDLGQARALAVAALLRSEGVPAGVLAVRTMGSREPEVASEPADPRNRRVNFAVRIGEFEEPPFP